MTPKRSTRMATRRSLWVVCVLLAYLAISAWYAVTIPPFESPDELHHMGYIVHLVRESRLPIQQPGQTTLFEQEGSQPPLYYLMASALVRRVDLSDLEEVSEPNPYVRMGLPSAIDNRNLVMHPPTGAPWRDSLLALLIVRCFSIALGAGTVLCTHWLGRLLFPRHPRLALAAAATNAFTPMFLFISASANNDNLIILLASLTLVALAHAGLRGVNIPRLLVLGALCGAALLAKLSGIALLLLVLIALLAISCSEQTGVPITATPRELSLLGRHAAIGEGVRRWLGWAAFVLVPALAIAGWWYLRNLRLYGELTGIRTMLAIFGTRERMPSLSQLLGEFRGFCMSYWGIFGIFNVLMCPEVVYPILLGLSTVALAGTTWALYDAWRCQRRLPWLLIGALVIWVGALGASLLRWTSMTYASQGRLVFPGVSPLSLALVGGLGAWFHGRGRLVAHVGLPALLLAISLAQPWASITPAYAAPPPLRLEDVPPTAQPVRARFGPVELLAFEIDRTRVEPGERCTLTLYWQTHAPLDEDLTLYIHVFGRDGAKIAQRDSFHGGGTCPTSYWQPGQVIRDTYAIAVAADAASPTAAEIVVGLYRRDDMVPITATDPSGNPVGKLTITRIKVAGETSPSIPQWATEARFGEAILLRGYDLDWDRWDGEAPLPITLHWGALRRLDRDLTVFIHLVNEQGQILGQGDGPPCNGEYPTTFWEEGETLEDHHLIIIQRAAQAASNLRILVGFYDPVTGERLMVSDLEGAPLGDHVKLSPSLTDW